MKAEERLIQEIRRVVDSTPELAGRLRCGIGDDAAILDRFNGNLVVTTDMLCDGIDFVCGQDQPEDIGRKTLAVNLSDLAAMGAVPLAVVISVLLPLDAEKQIGPVSEFAQRFFRGMVPLAKQYAAAIAGGDTNAWHGAFAVSVTALGSVEPDRALLRSGALPGDRIFVTGAVGGSIFGRQFRFYPRIVEALYLARYHRVHAAIDISDGLEIDLARLARESSVRYTLNRRAVPLHSDLLSPPADAETFPGWEIPKTPIEHALGDGEDFELILALPPEEARRLIAEQPFLAAARGREKYRRRIESICQENGFLFSEEDYRQFAEAQLTEIGFFEEGIPADNPKDAGWEYQF